jgi:hypothetical protein
MDKHTEKPAISPEAREYMRALGRLGGRAKASAYTPEQRSRTARKAALKRWRTTGKKKGEKSS